MNLKKNNKQLSTILVVSLLLTIMASLMLYVASQDTTIVDESPHIVAGYSYLTQREYRLNPEHPPLIKMITGIPLLFKDLNFPLNSTAWTDDLNGQWTLGTQFLHESGNDPISITFLARLGAIVITLLLGILLFIWAKKLYGAPAGIFVTILFVFSPTFLAHGLLVATDVGAAFAFLLAIYFFLQYLQKQTRKNIILAGIAFGIAQLMKFSLILLIPYFAFIVIMWVIFRDRPMELVSMYTAKRILKYFGKLIIIGVIGLLLVYPVYQYTMLDYSAERQLNDAEMTLESSPYKAPAKLVIWMSDKPILRTYAQFFMGHLMVFQRVAGGNTVYFLGDVSSTAWTYYFPVVFALKVPLALLILTTIAANVVLGGIKKKTSFALINLQSKKEKLKKLWQLIYNWISKYFIEISMAIFIVFYWIVSMLGNLNIGIRHVLPTFPFIYIILAGIFTHWINKKINFENLKFFQKVKLILSSIFKQWIRGSVVVILMIWYVLSSLSVFPNPITYFNELVGGASNGYKYVVDSNLDWGQDLGRLAKYVEENNIDKIKLNYFGGGSPSYYLGDKVKGFDPNNETQRKGWIAVSATLLQNGRGIATKDFRGSTTHYMWLNEYEPVTVIGHSIFVYYIP